MTSALFLAARAALSILAGATAARIEIERLVESHDGLTTSRSS